MALLELLRKKTLYSFPPRMDRKTALAILNVKDPIDAPSSYKSLMKIYHPDKFKTPKIATELNKAKKFLLNNP